jgi:hypothetical protein
LHCQDNTSSEQPMNRNRWNGFMRVSFEGILCLQYYTSFFNWKMLIIFKQYP